MKSPAWWTIARMEITLAIRDRGSLIWSLIAPVVMAWIFGNMFGDASEPSPTRVAIDAGANPAFVADAFARTFASGGLTVDSLGSEGAIRVQVPDSLLAGLGSDRELIARVHKGDASDMRAQEVGARVRDAMYRVAFAGESIERDGIDTASHPLAVRTETLGTVPRVPGGAVHTLPAMLVMFIMFQLTTFFLAMWVEDIKTGKTRRIAMSPTPTRDILVAQIVARLAWGVLQVAIILGVGSLLLGVRLPVKPVQLASLLAAYMIAAASLGMLMASFFRSTDKANAVGVIVSLVMAALGGCWWPLEIVPDAMRKLAMIFPTGQAMDAMGEMTVLGAAAAFPLSNVLVLLGMAAIMMPVAARRMKAQLVT